MTTSATAVLRKEHEAILRMLDATETVARNLEDSAPVAPELLKGLLEFFQLFADRCHHGKEEDRLFPLLIQKGLPGEGGPIGVMLHEHAMGRSLIRHMAEATNAYAAGDQAAGRLWAEAADGYTGLLRAHIQKENNVLFVMAERLLSDEEQAQLARAFDQIEIEKMGAGTHERLHAQMAAILGEVFAGSR